VAETGTPTQNQLLGKLSTELVVLMKEAAGKGPTKSRSYWAGSDTILVVLGGGYTLAEETLYQGGRGNSVRDSRHAFQDTVEHRMRTTVERLFGRSVVAFLSASHQNPDLTVLTFLLEPTEPDSPISAADQASPH
jgi:uncharacterized protein YbcI